MTPRSNESAAFLPRLVHNNMFPTCCPQSFCLPPLSLINLTFWQTTTTVKATMTGSIFSILASCLSCFFRRKVPQAQPLLAPPPSPTPTPRVPSPRTPGPCAIPPRGLNSPLRISRFSLDSSDESEYEEGAWLAQDLDNMSP
jgi:hypothetical protein